MTISTFDGFIAAAKQYVSLMKSASRTTVAAGWFSVFDLAGNPGSGVLAGTSTAAGVVPVGTTGGATTGCPTIDAFGGSNKGYLAQVDFGNTVACRMKILDMLFKAGAYAFTAGTTTLSAQPSYSSRVPSGTDFKNTQIWLEVTTAFLTGTQWQIQVTYTNQDGTAGRTTVINTAWNAAALTLGRMYQLPLQAGDTGVQKIESVIATNGGTAMTAGNFNILVLKPLWTGRCKLANDGDVHELARTGMPTVYASSALILIVNADSTSTGIPEIEVVIANG